MSICLCYGVDQRQSGILPEVWVSEDDFVEVVSEIVCCLSVGVSYALVYSKERELAGVIASCSGGAALNDCHSI